MPIDLNIPINAIIDNMVRARDFLLDLEYEYNGYVFNAFNCFIAIFCISRILVLLFGDFIGDEELDDIRSEEPID